MLMVVVIVMMMTISTVAAASGGGLCNVRCTYFYYDAAEEADDSRDDEKSCYMLLSKDDTRDSRLFIQSRCGFKSRAVPQCSTVHITYTIPNTFQMGSLLDFQGSESYTLLALKL